MAALIVAKDPREQEADGWTLSHAPCVSQYYRIALTSGEGKAYNIVTGETHEGAFRDNRVCGIGRLTVPTVGSDGERTTATYTGSFESYGVLSGRGELTVVREAGVAGHHGALYEYTGPFVNGLESGSGTARFANGLQYTGPFEHGKPLLQPSSATMLCVTEDEGQNQDQE